MELDRIISPINIRYTAKRMKKSKQFAIISRNGCNWAMTESMVLKITEREAFLLQCKLEIEKRNIFYRIVEKENIELERQPDITDRIERWLQVVNNVAAGELLALTGIALLDNGDVPSIELFAAAGGYTAVSVNDSNCCLINEIVRYGGHVVINNIHVMSCLTDAVWQNNAFIADLNRTDDLEELTDD